MSKANKLKQDAVILHDGQIMKEVDKTRFEYLRVFGFYKIMEREMKTQLVEVHERIIKLILNQS